MAYNKKKLFKQAKEATVTNKLFFIEDIISYLPCAKPTFYDLFPIDSDEMNELKELLEQNRTQLKVSMRNKWYKSDAPALQIALMKLICNKREWDRLNGVKLDVNSKNTNINANVEVTPEEAQNIIGKFKGEY